MGPLKVKFETSFEPLTAEQVKVISLTTIALLLFNFVLASERDRSVTLGGPRNTIQISSETDFCFFLLPNNGKVLQSQRGTLMQRQQLHLSGLYHTALNLTLLRHLPDVSSRLDYGRALEEGTQLH
jgi:hypothetical protein